MLWYVYETGNDDYKGKKMPYAWSRQIVAIGLLDL